MEISNVKNIGKGALKLKFDLTFPNLSMTLKDLGYMQSGDRSWINLPARKYTDSETGDTKYFPLVWIEKEKKDAFDRKCIELLQSYIDNPPPKPQEEDIPF